FIKIETPPGSSLAYTREKVRAVEAIVRTIPETRYIYTTLGGGPSGTVDVPNSMVRVIPKAERPKRSVEVIAADVRDKVARLTGLTTSVYTTDWGGGRKQLAINVQGEDIGTLNAVA